MEIGKGIRRVFSSDYRQYQGQLKKADKTVPKGAPSLTASAKTPVGPNKHETLSPKEKKKASPDYPVNYQIPVEAKERGIFRKTSRFEPTGDPAAFTTGPGLLPPEDRVPGRFDYSTIPDITVVPIDANGTTSAATGISRKAKGGIPADPETGFPTIPPLKKGKYKLEESYPRQAPAMPSAARKKPSLDSLGYPKEPD